MFDTNRILRFLTEWRTHMDAQVIALQQNVATLQTDVARVLVMLQAAQSQLSAGIDAGDETAITAANAALVAANARLAAVIPASPVSP
jgi:hypothetical protein